MSDIERQTGQFTEDFGRVRQEIANTVATPGEVEEELAHLRSVLAKVGS